MYSPVSVHSSQSSVKKGAMSSSTPSSVRNPTGLEIFKSLSDKFLGQIDIQLRASLYSLNNWGHYRCKEHIGAHEKCNQGITR